MRVGNARYNNMGLCTLRADADYTRFARDAEIAYVDVDVPRGEIAARFNADGNVALCASRPARLQ